LLPLVAFGSAGQRLGSGAGFYDRALATVANQSCPKRIGLGFDLQFSSALVARAWDVPLHMLISELGVQRFY
jgi:5-formyltetrahydrofolate cyclo-ligase